MTLRSQFFLRIPQPFHVFSVKMRLVSRCGSIFVTRGVSALPDSCAVVLTTVSCVLQPLQWVVLVQKSFVSASCLVLLASECIVTMSVSSCQNTSTWMTQRMMTEGANDVSRTLCCHTTDVVSHRRTSMQQSHVPKFLSRNDRRM